MNSIFSNQYRQAAEGLWETLRVINSNATLDETLDFIVGQADALNEAHFVTISMLKGPDGPIQIHAMRGEFPEEMRQVEMDVGEGAVGRAIMERRTIAISNVSQVVQASVQEAIDEDHQVFVSAEKQAVMDLAAKHFQAVLAIPLMTSKRIYGALVYYYPEPREFSQEEIQLASSFAEQAALAIENARLHQAEADRQRELKLLLDLAAAANNPLNMDEMLESTMDCLVELVGASRVGLMLTDKETGELGTYLIRPEQVTSVPQAEMDKMLQACTAVAASGKPLFLSPDPAQGLLEPGALLPLQSQSRPLGVMGIIGSKGAQFSQGQLSLFTTIADQLGTMFENAYLSAEVRQNAVQAERNRLARDLHDAVTQTLFSASLVADVLPKVWEMNPDLGKQKLEDLQKLTRGALSEMRTMLMELRPSALVDTDIEDLLKHLINAFTARSMVPVEFKKEGDEDPPVDVKEVLYRVAQEALNNIEKYACAQNVEISLTRQPEAFSLKIQDDGCGFDPEAVSQDHLGLGIMAERAKNIRAVLQVNSTASVGTEISLRWDANLEERE
jgi:signal transduction histidine kinase